MITARVTVQLPSGVTIGSRLNCSTLRDRIRDSAVVRIVKVSRGDHAVSVDLDVDLELELLLTEQGIGVGFKPKAEA